MGLLKGFPGQGSPFSEDVQCQREQEQEPRAEVTVVCDGTLYQILFVRDFPAHTQEHSRWEHLRDCPPHPDVLFRPSLISSSWQISVRCCKAAWPKTRLELVVFLCAENKRIIFFPPSSSPFLPTFLSKTVLELLCRPGWP